MKIQAELGMSDKIAVEATDKRYTEFVMTIGDIEVTLDRATAEALFQQLEEAVYDEDSWSRNLEAKADKLQMRVDELEEYISNYGWEIPA